VGVFIVAEKQKKVKVRVREEDWRRKEKTKKGTPSLPFAWPESLSCSVCARTLLVKDSGSPLQTMLKGWDVDEPSPNDFDLLRRKSRLEFWLAEKVLLQALIRFFFFFSLHSSIPFISCSSAFFAH
jgi:hypothetical protein